MWRFLGKTAHYWPSWFYKLISKTHSKLIRFNHTYVGEMIIGDQILLLETLGNKTNKIRKTPLTYANYNGDYIVAASYSGNDKTPDWFFNLETGHVFITIDNERFRANYELINPEDKHYFWNLLDSVYPTFQIYRQRTNRDIPLIKFFKTSV